MPKYCAFDVREYLAKHEQLLNNMGTFEKHVDEYSMCWNSQPTIQLSSGGSGESSINFDFDLKLGLPISNSENSWKLPNKNLMLVPIITWRVGAAMKKRHVLRPGSTTTNTTSQSLNQNAFFLGRYRDFSRRLLVIMNMSTPMRSSFVTIAHIYTLKRGTFKNSYTPRASIMLAFDTNLLKFKFVLINYAKKKDFDIKKVQILDPNTFLKSDETYYLKGMDYDQQYTPLNEILQNGLFHVWNGLIQSFYDPDLCQGDDIKITACDASDVPDASNLQSIMANWKRGFAMVDQSETSLAITDLDEPEPELDLDINFMQDKETFSKTILMLANQSLKKVNGNSTILDNIPETIKDYSLGEREKTGVRAWIMKRVLNKIQHLK